LTIEASALDGTVVDRIAAAENIKIKPPVQKLRRNDKERFDIRNIEIV